MFTWRHFLWLAICLVVLICIVYFYNKKKPPLKKVLTSACIVCVFSEVSKIASVSLMVPSENGGLIMPYIPHNHLPLHFCSIMIFAIYYCRFGTNNKRKENMLAFMAPTCIIGALLALALPSIFNTSIPVEDAFKSLLSYQFFLYHTMLIALGIIIILSDEIEWTKQRMYGTIQVLYVLGVASIYTNSLLASPTYVDGELVSVDFWTNFFFTYQNPLGISLTEKWQWGLYVLILAVLAFVIISLFYRFILFRRNKSKKDR